MGNCKCIFYCKVMESKLELFEIGENHYSVKGVFLGKNFDEKSDGYTDVEIKIECLDFVVKFRDFSVSGYSDYLSTAFINQKHEYRANISSNYLASLYQILFMEGKLDKRIIRLEAWGSTSNPYNLKFTSLRYKDKTPLIPIRILNYGRSHKSNITIFVEAETFFDIIKNKKLPDNVSNHAISLFKSEYRIDIQQCDAGTFIDLLRNIDYYEIKLRELNSVIHLAKEDKQALAEDYYKKKYPFKIGDFVFDGYDVIKITDFYLDDCGYSESERRHPIERCFYYIIEGNKVTSSGESKKSISASLSKQPKLICSEEDYGNLAKQHGFKKGPNRTTLLQLLLLKEKAVDK